MLTSDATEAARLAVQQQLEKDVPAPGIDAATVQWKELFRSEPWDPEGKVRSCKRSHPLYVQHLLRSTPTLIRTRAIKILITPLAEVWRF